VENFKIFLSKLRQGMEWVELTKDTDKGKAFVYNVMNV
jgi:hypothetical protein